MAQQITSDTATEVDITIRKDDSFFLELTLTKADGTHYDFSAYETASLAVYNTTGSIIRDFVAAVEVATLPTVAGAINLANSSSGILKIDTAGGNMNIPSGMYSYKLSITDNDATPVQKITLMFGKFKVNA